MKIINHSVQRIINENESSPITHVADIARTCYQSEGKDYKAEEALIRRLIKNGHTAMIEFANVTFRIITDRGVTHELVRHRIASFAQESTRYCNYGNKDIAFVLPINLQKPNDESLAYKHWCEAMLYAEESYNKLLNEGCSPQIARSVLPNSLKTEICVKFNMRSFRNFVMLRTAKAAHPDMQYVANLCVDAVRGTDYFIFIEDLVE